MTTEEKEFSRAFQAIKYCLIFSFAFIVIIAFIELQRNAISCLITLVLFQVQRERWRGCFDE